MVLPLLVAGGAVALGSALIQWQNSRSASAASAMERARIQGLINKVQDPSFDFNQIDPQEFQVVGKFVPQVAPLILEKNPTLMQAQGAGAQAGRGAQMQALQNLRERSLSGTDAQSEIAQSQAQRAANATAQSNRSQLDETFQRRGQMGSGMQFAGNLAALSDTQNAQALAGEQSAMGAANRRDSALSQSADLGGQLYNQDMSMEEKNANLINDFNRRLTSQQNEFGRFNAGVGNEASMFNLNQAQRNSDKNIGQANEFRKYNQSYGNQQRQQKFDNDLSRLGLNQRQSAGNLQQINQDTAQKNSAIAGAAGAITSGMGAYQTESGQNDRFDKTFEQNERLNKAKYGNKF